MALSGLYLFITGSNLQEAESLGRLDIDISSVHMESQLARVQDPIS
jgi:hypothetical protein